MAKTTKAAPVAVKAAPKAAPAPAPAPVAAAAPDPDLAAVGGKPPKAAKAPKAPAATCSGVKKNGEPCTAKVKAGLDVCVDHQPVLDRLTDEQKASWDTWLAEQDAATFADLLGWHKVRDLIGEPVNAPKVAAAA